jgi:hypothetical protein
MKPILQGLERHRASEVLQISQHNGTQFAESMHNFRVLRNLIELKLRWAILYFALLSKILKQNTLPSKLFNKMPLCTLFFYFFLFHLHYYALFIFSFSFFHLTYIFICKRISYDIDLYS